MNKYRIAGIAGVVFLATVLVLSSSYIWGTGLNRGNVSTEYFTAAQLANFNVTGPGVTVSGNTSTIYVNSSSDIVVMMGPMNSGSMYSFEIFGVINPQIVIRDGAVVHFTVINIDDDSYHNFVIGTQGPPYYYMGSGMMNGYNNYGYGSMMYGYYGNNHSYGYMMAYLPPMGAGHYAYTNVTYDFSNNGTYWYLCTYPGHAQNGMYCKIIVS